MNISISNDTILEDTEYFDVGVSSLDSSVHITQGTSRVYIIDDDGVRVGLHERAITVSEGEGQIIPICVEIVGRFQESIEVMLESQSASALGKAVTVESDHVISDMILIQPLLSLYSRCRLHPSLTDSDLYPCAGPVTGDMCEYFCGG